MTHEPIETVLARIELKLENLPCPQHALGISKLDEAIRGNGKEGLTATVAQMHRTMSTLTKLTIGVLVIVIARLVLEFLHLPPTLTGGF